MSDTAEGTHRLVALLAATTKRAEDIISRAQKLESQLDVLNEVCLCSFSNTCYD